MTNVCYTGIKQNDYSNKSFVIDIFSFLILYFNPFNLERKFETPIERDYVNVLWTYLMPETLYSFISKNDNIKALNKTRVKFQHAVEIIKQFIEEESIRKQEQQFNILKEYLTKYLKIYQFIFGNLFPRYFGKIDDYGIQSKIEFNSYYKNYLLQKNVLEWEKNSSWMHAINDEFPKTEPSISNNTPSISDEKELDLKEEKKISKVEKKRKEKKRSLEEKLNKNTKKIMKTKKLKINK